MNYLEALKVVHEHIRPDKYVEIGVSKGTSFQLAGCRSIGIDPAPQMVSNDVNKTIYSKTSDDFFSEYELMDILSGPFDLAFIDGLHWAEFALRDFINLERSSHFGSVIVIDDVLPDDMVWANRERTTQEWTGDVYKLITILRRYRPDLHIQIFDVEMKGMAIVSNLNNTCQILENHYPGIEKEIHSGVYDVFLREELVDSFQPASTDHLSIFTKKLMLGLAKRKYLELLQACLINEVNADLELRIFYLKECLEGMREFRFEEFHDITHRLKGEYQEFLDNKNIGKFYKKRIKNSGFAPSMIGKKRMGNLVYCLDIIQRQSIPGDFIECGVWRGGASIMMAAYNKMYQMNRTVFVADSFDGLPVPTHPMDEKLDLSKNKYPELAIHLGIVKENFRKYGLLNENTRFVKGWFKDTLPALDKDLKIALLRLDGDLYESTTITMEALYDKVVHNGIIIVDDFSIPACKMAILDYFKNRNLKTPEFQEIDWTGIFWIKNTL
ncbi:MAG TPA: TylF/MycF/NovP-related O-methyltransferase [Saprospiraceae bacterium]|nr:TylF/MycF/NovP-related O-methyltransferase [Saprospiraceae bacterium]